MAEARAAYRQLLRAIGRHISAAEENPWKQYARSQVRLAAGVSDANKARGQVQLAQDYALLVNSVQKHKDLLLSYNIGIDRETRQRNLLQSSAASVGLRLPQAAWHEDAASDERS